MLRETLPLILLLVLFLLGVSAITMFQNMEPTPQQEHRMSTEALKRLEQNGMLEQYLKHCGMDPLQ